MDLNDQNVCGYGYTYTCPVTTGVGIQDSLWHH